MRAQVVDPERAVVGAMMLGHDALLDVVDVLRADDLHDMRLGMVYTAAVQVDGQGKPVDPMTVAAKLREQKLLTQVGGEAVLADLYSEAPPKASISHYAKVVHAAAVRRHIREAGARLVQLGEEESDDPDALLELAHQLVEDASPRDATGLVGLGEGMDDTIESLEQQPTYTPTPWRQINGLIDGMRPGALYVVGARPGNGKTIVGLNLAVHLARWGDVSMSSLEMSRDELRLRLLAQRAGVHLTAIARHALTRGDWEKVAQVANELRFLRVYVDHRSGVTTAQIRAHARAVHRRGKLGAIVVDYLQLVAGERGRPRWEQVGDISRDLKVMARDFNVPVVALAQLNRESESDRRPPRMSDLRESGSIEQDSDVVLLLQRGWDDVALQHTDTLDVHVGKNRHGMTGKASLLWEGQYARVSDLPWAE